MNRTTKFPIHGSTRAWFCIFLGGTAAIAYWITVLREQTGLGPGIFHRLFLFDDYVGACVLIGVILAALSSSVQQAGIRLANAIGDHPIVTAVVTTAVLAAGARFGYLGHPLSMDEYAPVFQSQVFAAGGVCGRFPPELVDWLIPRGFQNVFFVASRETGCVASAYWPGFAALLTPFSALGIPWLANPLVGGVTVLAVHQLGLELFSERRSAGLAVMLTLASTAFAINAMSFYSMAAHLLFNAVFLICILRRRVLYAWIAGLIGGWALVLHNPFPHALFALPCMFWLAAHRNRIPLLTAAMAGYAPFLLLPGMLWTQFLQELKVAAPAVMVLAPTVDSTTSVLLGLWNSATRIFQSPDASVLWARTVGLAKLWLWASPGLLPLAAWGLWVRRSDPRMLLLGAVALSTLAGYLFYPESQGHGWGFRYFHSAWMTLPLLATAALIHPHEGISDGRESLRGFVAGGALVALVVMNLLRTYQSHEFISSHLAQLPVAPEGGALIVVNPDRGYYSMDLVQNDPFLRNRVVRMVSLGAEDDATMVARHFPGMTLLNQGYRGSVWGYASTNPERSSDLPEIRGGEHREQE